ncbi:ABC-2 type transport system permease protein [Pseudonocardia thermophila]|jgi:ABC-type transport system involved in multi-copper enzyme maturation, permease component|uniref:ABC-2 type transport system permease protein n=1 Tax=Pseudonocardia thermophila TaxID=1848 RepID=A0A1M6WGU1_PSETH|nr:ABC transporter permease subunit [Pseudonocardia thermophila]SHK92735.1 ABC-2 type transport system permease protein [Pseudonocardia thermophila]
MTAATATGPAATVRGAPLGRLLGAELRWVLRRPRTIAFLVLFALVPVVIGAGVAIADRAGGPGRGLIGAVAGNGLVLPVAALTVSLALLLPLAVAMAAADALAGESAAGTLRGLLVAPVGRLRLVVMKAFGVLVVAAAATLVIAVLGVLCGLVVVGWAEGQMVTLSGTTLGFGEAMGRVALAAAWTTGQLLAVGAVALAVSSLTEHPLVVLAAVLGGVIVSGVLAAIPALSWLQPYLLTTGWSAGADVLRDPLPLDGLGESTLRALCYLVVGAGVTVARMLRRDA